MTVGLNEQDAFFALGVAPVGLTDWMGFENGIGPWAEEAAAAAGPKPELLEDTDGISFEKIAALRPDVLKPIDSSTRNAVRVPRGVLRSSMSSYAVCTRAFATSSWARASLLARRE